MENKKYKLNKFVLITPIIIAFLFLFSSCLPWGPGTSGQGPAGMGGMMGGNEIAGIIQE